MDLNHSMLGWTDALDPAGPFHSEEQFTQRPYHGDWAVQLQTKNAQSSVVLR
jgi:hypothetical protein